MAVFAGIDLGTSNTIIAVGTENGIRTLSPLGAANIPSCIMVENGKVSVGRSARNKRSRRPEAYIANTKPFMPNLRTWNVGGQEYTPKDVATHVLKAAADAIRDELQTEEEIKAVITVPACFTSSACAATREAAAEAGITCLKLQSEPVAAALAYSYDLHYERNVLVIDTGGGTFDLAILQVDSSQGFHRGSNRNFVFDRNTGIGGDAHLGGNDFDKVILDTFLLPALTGESMGDPLKVAIRNQQLEDLATDIKEALQPAGNHSIHKVKEFPDGTRLDVTVTKEDYIKACGGLIARMSVALHKLMQSTSASIDRILLVGGMASDPCLQRLVQAMFPDIPWRVPAQYMNMIAAGAALEAWNMGNIGISFSNAVTFTALGIAVQSCEGSGNPGRMEFHEILPRGESVSPGHNLEREHEFYIFDPSEGQFVVHILESTGSKNLEDCFLCASYTVDIPQDFRGEGTLRLRMILDSDRILRIRCVDAATDSEMICRQLQLNL